MLPIRGPQTNSCSGPSDVYVHFAGPCAQIAFFSRSLKMFILCVTCRRVGHQAGGNGRSQGASYCHASCLRGDGENRRHTGRRSIRQTRSTVLSCLRALFVCWQNTGIISIFVFILELVLLTYKADMNRNLE